MANDALLAMMAATDRLLDAVRRQKAKADAAELGGDTKGDAMLLRYFGISFDVSEAQERRGRGALSDDAKASAVTGMIILRGPFNLEPVGEDYDGTVKPVAELTVEGAK